MARLRTRLTSSVAGHTLAFVVTQKLTSIETFGLILKSPPYTTCYDPGSIPVFVISAAILTVTEICTLLIFIKLIL